MLPMLSDQMSIEEQPKQPYQIDNKTKTPSDSVNWKFLDQIPNNSQLLDSDQHLNVGFVGTATTNDYQLPTTTTTTNLSNGMALTTGLLNVEILSQPIVVYTDANADVNADVGIPIAIPNFQFTTPTSTFRRKKQLQLDRKSSSIEPSATWTAPSRRIVSAHISDDVTVTMLEDNTNTQPAAAAAAAAAAATRKLPVISTTSKPKLLTGTTPKTKRRNSQNLGQMTATSQSGSGSGSVHIKTTIMPGGGVGGGVAAAAGSAIAGHSQSQLNASRNRQGITTATRTGGVGGNNVGRVDGFVGGIETYLGLIGWRKKCLYTLFLLLMLLIITNLVLTLWILKVMEFSTEGMGQLKIVPGGIQLSGQAIIMDMLRASTIRSRHGQPISIESSRNFSINTRDSNGMLENHLFLGHDKFECLSSGFRINDTNGRNLFSVNRNEVTIGAHALRIDGEGGAIFRESVQTPHVRAEPGRELRLESPTRQLEMTAAKDINLQSRAGGIEIMALEDVKFRALDGSLRLESSKILMPNLRTAQPPILGTAQNRDHLHRVFQLCACSNGKLFLAAPHSICAGDDSTVCR